MRCYQEGLAAGTLNAVTARDLRLSDLIVRGRPLDGDDDGEVYVVVEVSAGIGRNDIDRAVRRAALLGRLRPAQAAVAGEWSTAETEHQAANTGVWTVHDGQVREAVEIAAAQASGAA